MGQIRASARLGREHTNGFYAVPLRFRCLQKSFVMYRWYFHDSDAASWDKWGWGMGVDVEVRHRPGIDTFLFMSIHDRTNEGVGSSRNTSPSGRKDLWWTKQIIFIFHICPLQLCLRRSLFGISINRVVHRLFRLCHRVRGWLAATASLIVVQLICWNPCAPSIATPFAKTSSDFAQRANHSPHKTNKRIRHRLATIFHK